MTGRHFSKRLGEEDAVVVTDEFSFLIDEDESLPSQIQRVWDTERQDTGMTLVLVGFPLAVQKLCSGVEKGCKSESLEILHRD